MGRTVLATARFGTTRNAGRLISIESDAGATNSARSVCYLPGSPSPSLELRSTPAREAWHDPKAGEAIQINVGYELTYQCPQPTPMILALSIHYSRASDIVKPDHLTIQPSVPIEAYRDSFGNWCSRLVAPAGLVRLRGDGIVNDSGLPESTPRGAMQRAVHALPGETLQFLLGSRYCETDLLSETAWQLFSGTSLGWARVQAVCDFVHDHIRFSYDHARATKTAHQVFTERVGVCRDYAHLAIAFCRCLNIPARYCTGYLGDIGMPPPYAPMDFAGWFEAFLDDGWYTFDPRNNTPRIGRVLIARGRDAADVAISTTFGPNTMETFEVWTHPVEQANGNGQSQPFVG